MPMIPHIIKLVFFQTFRIIGREKEFLVYSDPSTYSGPDEEPLFDFDDELVVMAKDLGKTIRPEDGSEGPENVQQVRLYVYVHENLYRLSGRF